jgi:8-oxo-dGTP pyrophosphatase MutT (NUDIX family)
MLPNLRGAGGVVFRPDGAVLLLRHQEGTWVFPKGHIEQLTPPPTGCLFGR